MSIVQDLYNIFDHERARKEAKKLSKYAVLRELAENLAFIRVGIKENLSDSKIISGLENQQFIQANDNGFDFNSINRKALSHATYGSVKEFDKYKGWPTDKLIKNAYERISTLRKLKVNDPGIDAHSRLQNLFKFLMVLMAHINNEQLQIKPKQPN